MKSQFDKAQKARSGCYFVPNACSPAHFDISAPCPPALQAIPGPRIGFIGAMLKRRFAAKIIKAAAACRPQWSFVLIGEADKNIEHLLRPLPNIHLLGRFPHSEMPAFAAHFDICIIANVFDAELSFGFPKKLYEYLASGKPVVATPMPEVLPFAPLVKTANS
jgi:glycosyltransferase involved in cell wall biosynthesis